MRDHRWRIVPASRGISVLYLLAGVLLAVNAARQLRTDMAVLPVISGLAALALVVTAVVGLARPDSRTRTH
ncbi:hypothetical protein [Streptomyces griseoaurantiacus]|uniref:Uncharacterized protein n=1 Tax=Streptomyces griseoaurantiacus TaxID=68213 RepID=A0A1G7PXJ3_9ACTN|nr:hypothetical protein [Streptomyces jietaisiensis]SDF90953.1 hypothetical protein SAMN05216260_11214 [Streptomyces jietaisiensis]